MKISRSQKVAGGATALFAAAAVGAIVFGSNHSPGPTQIVVRPDAATASVSTSASTPVSSHAVAKPAAIVPRSSVVVKKPAVQEATVTSPTDVITTPADPITSSLAPTPPTVQVSDPATQGPNGGPLPSMQPPVPPPTTAKPPIGPGASPSPSVSN